MPETDKILEAEQNLNKILSELERMKSAADLLQNSQTQVDAVLSSSEKVIKETEKFSSDCGLIISKLSQTDMNKSLEELKNIREEIISKSDYLDQSIKGDIDNKITSINNNLQNELKNLSDTITQNLVSIKTSLKNIDDKIVDFFNDFVNQSKKSKIFNLIILIIVLIILVMNIISFTN
jgi:uncharacterized protein YicC (UPF0701 family)